MPRIPVVSCTDAVKAFERAGWSVKRWGNHVRKAHRRQRLTVIMTKPGSIVSLSIPTYREIAKGTLRKLIRLAGLTVDEFTQLLS